MSLKLFRPLRLGTGPTGKPAVEWWRHGFAIDGEPFIVTEVREYETKDLQLKSILSFDVDLESLPT